MSDPLSKIADIQANQKLWAEVDEDGSISVYYSTVGDERGLTSWSFFPSGTVVVSNTKIGTVLNLRPTPPSPCHVGTQ